jgi:DNA-binding NtrC family response regulator
LAIEDLGSSNGTVVRGRKLARGERRAIAVGEPIDLGRTLLIVQHLAVAARPRRFLTHGQLEMRLEEECARARSAGSTFALIRVRALEREQRTVVEDLLARELRAFDLLAEYSPGEYEALVVDTDSARAESVAERLEGLAREAGAVLKTRVAMYPSDGRDAEALVARGLGGAEMVIEAGVMRQLHRMIDRVAASNASVLILGETGVGKELVAEAVHARSKRRERQLLRLNCAALSDSLIESELFGHEKGAFSGAVAAKPGLLETADGGTVFLDEVGELPLSTQVKLLRVLEEKKVRRVGGVEARAIDVRLVSATNRDLEREIEGGRFRMDLFYRLNGISIVIPPLRERVEELRPLAELFAGNAARQLEGRRAPRFSAGALSALAAYSWPGNVRELRNVIERAVILAEGDEIGVEHLPLDKMAAVVKRPDVAAAGGGSIKSDIEALERRRILEALEESGGVQAKAAKLLGWSRGTFLARMDAYKIPRKRKG